MLHKRIPCLALFLNALALPLRSLSALDQEQESGRARSEA